MQSPEWEKVKALFHATLAEKPAARSAFLARQTGDDTALRDNVASLLAADDNSEDFLETPAAALSVGDLPDPLPSDGRVGPYRLIREIGRGGMGTVYLAARDDGEFQHQVAVKLVKRGMDTDLILSRFRHERQMLAGLDHPNIARLLDGGTTRDGRPYFVLEYVDGESLREYCDRRHATVIERLALFRTVCSAVQYAHQNLIVHRDIKMSNIVVTHDGVPKLLDFGIAKWLDVDRSNGPVTATDTLHALTPEYASPEQIRGDPVTTSTDVYSLGVLLFELLTGHRPFASRGRRPDEIARDVCETEPSSPSDAVSGKHVERLRRNLRGDLDTIVLMALRKDPRRRYGSVEQLSEDIRRHLEGRPVTAQRDTIAYRASKFARRNRAALAGAFVLAASLVGGMVTTAWQARVARAERARAERRFSEVRSLATSFLFELHDAIVNLPGSTPARALLVQRALGSLDGLARDAQGDLVLQKELAVAYQKVGDVQGNGYNSNLGNTAGALRSYEKSIDLLEPLAKADATNADVQNALANGYKGLAAMFSSTGALKDALRAFERAVAVQQQLIRSNPTNVAYRSALAELYNQAGDTKGGEGLANLGDSRGALERYRASVALREEIMAEAPKNVEARVGLANSLMNLGYQASSMGDTAGAKLVFRSVQLLEGVVAELPNDATRRAQLMSGYARLRQPLADAARFDEALAVDRKLHSMLDTMIAADKSNILFQRNRGVFYNYLGRDLRAAGSTRLSVQSHRRALAIAERLAAVDAGNVEHRHDVAMSRYYLAEALADALDSRAAMDQYRLAAAAKQRLRISEPSNLRHGDDLALIYGGLGRALMEAGDIAHADSAFRQAVPLAEAAAMRNADNRKANITLAITYSGAGNVAARRSAVAPDRAERRARCLDAIGWYVKSTHVWEEMQAKGALPASVSERPAESARAAARCNLELTR